MPWAERHAGMIAQIVVFTLSAIVLLVLRSDDLTAALAVMALTLCAVGGGGPLMGSELTLPPGLREAMGLFAWIATPLAFPFTGLAILYFPSRSALLGRRPWLHALPFIVSAPMIVIATLTGSLPDWARSISRSRHLGRPASDGVLPFICRRAGDQRVGHCRGRHALPAEHGRRRAPAHPGGPLHGACRASSRTRSRSACRSWRS